MKSTGDAYNRQRAAELESLLAQGVDKETAKRWIARPELRIFAAVEQLEKALRR
ncbi:hypothetical protein HY642_05170 [Candidatus Woesearchaeota archaeon]|nr:hypothetical protein [Candidatus Woesearchaeota archaeon]